MGEHGAAGERPRMEAIAERLGYERHPSISGYWRHPERGSTWIWWSLVARDIYQHMAQCTVNEYTGEENHHFETDEPGEYCACGLTRQWIDIGGDLQELLVWRPI